MLNTAVLNTILRYGLNTIGGAVVTHGYVANSTWQTIAGIVLAVVPAAIGALSSTNAARVKAVDGIPGVKVVPAPAMNDR